MFFPPNDVNQWGGFFSSSMSGMVGSRAGQAQVISVVCVSPSRNVESGCKRRTRSMERRSSEL